MAKRRPRAGRGVWLGVTAGAIVLLGGLSYWGFNRFGAGQGDKGPATATVKRGKLRVTVSADGTVRSDKTVDVKSQVEGMTRILEIVPESTRIDAAGLFLVKLDVSDLVKQLANQELKVKQAKAAEDLARSELEIQKGVNASEVAKAKLAREFAQIELDKYLKGDWQQQRQEADNAIIIASEELQRASDKLEWSKKLAAQGYISASELAADELDVKKSQLNVELAQLKLNVLKEYSHRKERTKRESDLREAEADLARVEARAKANEAKATTELEVRQESHRLEQEQLNKINRQIAAGTIYSPQPGLVVYYSTVRQRGSQQQAIDVGYQVREGETIISLPDLSVMVADVSVPEAKRASIEDGQLARVVVESQPKESLTGVVKSRGIMPLQQDFWARGNVQQFQVIISVADPPDWLLPGHKCRAQILVRELDDVMQVPIQAVFLSKDQHFCYVQEPGGKIRAVPVWVGLDDDNVVEIKAGLEVGWKVLLAEPPNAAKIALEKPSFEKPEPPARPALKPTTRPANGPVATAPDESADADARTLQIIERIRQRDPAEADRLMSLPPEQRRQEIDKRMRTFQNSGGRGDRPPRSARPPG